MIDFDMHARVAFYFGMAALGVCFGVLRLLGSVLKEVRHLRGELKSLKELHHQNSRFRSEQHLDSIRIIAQLARNQGINVPESLLKEDETKH